MRGPQGIDGSRSARVLCGACLVGPSAAGRAFDDLDLASLGLYIVLFLWSHRDDRTDPGRSIMKLPVDSLFGQIYSLLGQNHFPVPAHRELCATPCNRVVNRARPPPHRPIIRKIHCYFPCSQGIRRTPAIRPAPIASNDRTKRISVRLQQAHSMIRNIASANNGAEAQGEPR